MPPRQTRRTQPFKSRASQLKNSNGRRTANVIFNLLSRHSEEIKELKKRVEQLKVSNLTRKRTNVIAHPPAATEDAGNNEETWYTQAYQEPAALPIYQPSQPIYQSYQPIYQPYQPIYQPYQPIYQHQQSMNNQQLSRQSPYTENEINQLGENGGTTVPSALPVAVSLKNPQLAEGLHSINNLQKASYAEARVVGEPVEPNEEEEYHF
jgi:hypothetical protein